MQLVIQNLNKTYSNGVQALKDVIYLRKHKITQKENTYTIAVNSKPRRAGIDPIHKLIDRHSDDNTKGLVKNSQ